MKSNEERMEPREGQFHWRPPSSGCLKMNTDGAWKSQTGEGGAGVVVRDWRGILRAALAINLPHCASVAAVELQAIREGLLLAKEKGWLNITIEGDAKAELTALNKKKAADKDTEVIFNDILQLANEMQVNQFCFVPRQCNKLADTLAKFAFECTTPFKCFSNPPHWLNVVMEEDSV